MMEYARDEWGRSQKALESAKILVEVDPDSSVSRCYYAAFHAVTALFALDDMSFAKHSALRGAVHRQLVKTSRCPVAFGKDFDFLMELREAGDYGGSIHVTEADAETAIIAAQRILDTVQSCCQGLLST